MALSAYALQSLLSAAESGRVQAQIPEFSISFDPKDNAADDSWIDDLITQGVAAWKVSNRSPGRPAVLYTPSPVNPATGRMVTAFLWMTEFGLQEHGDTLYAAYQAAAKPALDRQAWEDQMRQDVVPASPAFAGQVLPYTPAPKPAKPKRPTGVDAQGFARSLGPRQTERSRYARNTKDLLATMKELGVGPNTQLSESNGTDPMTELHHRLIGFGDPAGLAWMDQHGIAVTQDAYRVVVRHTAEPKSIVEAWERLRLRGLDPQQPLSDGSSLWSAVNFRHGQGFKPLVGWLRTHQVNWHVPDAQGELPLAHLFGALTLIHHRQDFFLAPDMGEGGHAMLGMMTQMAALMGKGAMSMVASMGKEGREEQRDVRLLEQLALDMVADGVDPFAVQPNGQRPIDSLHPDQMRLDRALAQRTKQFPSFMLAMHPKGQGRLNGVREGYGQGMLAFIGKVEAATGKTYLHDHLDAIIADVTAALPPQEPAPTRKPRR